jgi:hypothetical protein
MRDLLGGQYGTGVGFLRVLQFPLPILIPPTAPHSSSIIRVGTIGQSVADVPSGLSLTQPQETKKKNYWKAEMSSTKLGTSSDQVPLRVFQTICDYTNAFLKLRLLSHVTLSVFDVPYCKFTWILHVNETALPPSSTKHSIQSLSLSEHRRTHVSSSKC